MPLLASSRLLLILLLLLLVDCYSSPKCKDQASQGAARGQCVSMQSACVNGEEGMQLAAQLKETSTQTPSCLFHLVTRWSYHEPKQFDDFNDSLQEQAATKIQAAYRGRLGRKKYVKMLYEQFAKDEAIRREKTLTQVEEGEMLVEKWVTFLFNDLQGDLCLTLKMHLVRAN
ncbi:hypothetical protein CAPTEDRAFT_206088 [Capitella teleta]|uniref:Glucagon / GIP / secretin / VIP family domain-containing protein n=1 Tax=Capitella teleta TaxID=283909 RepID=R7TUU7_CAPTE|nr:hypothetical protein CAPTEDRAFT_206088 [Capitella teleta]|eukprot:ELT97322.1 hypothetical protein CAPTEDRAFT_206088 [Capitella teleta]